MSAAESLSRRAARRFWGWGLADAALDARESGLLQGMLRRLDARFEPRAEPRVDDFDMPTARITPPTALAGQFSAMPLDRLNHAAGKSFADCARMWLRRPPPLPDWVAFPEDEQAIADILDWAAAKRVAVIPYGGGSSVCGGLEAAVGDGYAGVVSLDLERLAGCWKSTRRAAPRASRPARSGRSCRRN